MMTALPLLAAFSLLSGVTVASSNEVRPASGAGSDAARRIRQQSHPGEMHRRSDLATSSDDGAGAAFGTIAGPALAATCVKLKLWPASATVAQRLRSRTRF